MIDKEFKHQYSGSAKDVELVKLPNVKENVFMFEFKNIEQLNSKELSKYFSAM